MKLTSRSAIFALSLAVMVGAEEPMLPLPLAPGAGLPQAGTAGLQGFLKPSKSIKPPSQPAALASAPSIVQSPTAETRLRRLIVVSGDMKPEDIRAAIVACGQSRMPVTVAGGMSAPAPVLSDLAGLFGSKVNEDTQKQVLETLRKGMGTAAKPLKRAEIVGWLPSEGVMAVAVYPES